MSIISSDRYGGNWPDPGTVCLGDCEGMGTVPVTKRDKDYLLGWLIAEMRNPSEDGWHFLACRDCGGSGRRPS